MTVKQKTGSAILFLLMIAILLSPRSYAQQVIDRADVSAQLYHYPFRYNSSFLSRIDEIFFEELEKDLGRSIIFNNTSPEYTYIQHLKNKNTFFSLGTKLAELNQEEHADEIFRLLQRMVDDFPTQPSVYYQLARHYMGMENVDEAIEVLKKASLEFNIPPKSFSYLTQLYAENDEFIGRYNELVAYYLMAETTVFPDSKWIALYDSIKEQDQLYRGKYRPDDPRFEPQLQIDEQNALFLRELVIEHWSTPCLQFVLLYLP